MSVLIKGIKLPQHAAVNGDKDTAYKCVILSHPDSSVEHVIDSKFASPYDNGHKIQRYPLTELPTPHGRLIDADILESFLGKYWREEFPHYEANYRRIADDSEYFVQRAPTIIEAEASE